MGKFLQTAQRVRVAVLRFKNDRRPQALDQSALARDAEFGRKIAVDARDDRERRDVMHTCYLQCLDLLFHYRINTLCFP